MKSSIVPTPRSFVPGSDEDLEEHIRLGLVQDIKMDRLQSAIKKTSTSSGSSAPSPSSSFCSFLSGVYSKRVQPKIAPAIDPNTYIVDKLCTWSDDLSRGLISGSLTLEFPVWLSPSFLNGGVSYSVPTQQFLRLTATGHLKVATLYSGFCDLFGDLTALPFTPRYVEGDHYNRAHASACGESDGAYVVSGTDKIAARLSHTFRRDFIIEDTPTPSVEVQLSRFGEGYRHLTYSFPDITLPYRNRFDFYDHDPEVFTRIMCRTYARRSQVTDADSLLCLPMSFGSTTFELIADPPVLTFSEDCLWWFTLLTRHSIYSTYPFYGDRPAYGVSFLHSSVLLPDQLANPLTPGHHFGDHPCYPTHFCLPSRSTRPLIFDLPSSSFCSIFCAKRGSPIFPPPFSGFGDDYDPVYPLPYLDVPPKTPSLLPSSRLFPLAFPSGPIDLFFPKTSPSSYPIRHFGRLPFRTLVSSQAFFNALKFFSTNLGLPLYQLSTRLLYNAKFYNGRYYFHYSCRPDVADTGKLLKYYCFPLDAGLIDLLIFILVDVILNAFSIYCNPDVLFVGGSYILGHYCTIKYRSFTDLEDYFDRAGVG